MKIIHFASSIRHVGRSRSKQHENIPALIFFAPTAATWNMSHYAPVQQQMQEVVKPVESTRSSHSFPHLPLLSPTILNPVYVCASTAIVAALDRFRVDLSPMVTLLYATPLHSLYIILVFFYLYFVFVFRSVCGFTDCREAFARLFSFCFIFFLCCLLRVKSLKWKSIFILLLHVREQLLALHMGWAEGEVVLGSVHSQHPLLSVSFSLSLFNFAPPIYGMFYEWILFELNAHFFGV